MVLQDNLGNGPGKINRAEDIETVARVRSDQLELRRGQFAGLAENVGRHTELTEIVNAPRKMDGLHLHRREIHF